MQLDLFPRPVLTPAEKHSIFLEIRGAYWHIRNLRSNTFGVAPRRRYYRQVTVQKKRLLLAGVDKAEILDFLRCCRLKCSAKKQPFNPCPYCR
jgi:hypothetical protein